MKRYSTLFILFGILYNFIEILYTSLSSGSWALQGFTSLWMFPVGGILGVTLGAMNEFKLRIPYPLSALLGGLMITLLELVSGLILNKWLGFNLWDYSGSRFNFLGQIDLWHSLCWVAISPFAFWADDVMRHYLYEEPRARSLFRYYLGKA